MTEEQWLSSTDPVAMIRFVRDSTMSFRTRWLGWIAGPRFRVSPRKWRLLACAVARRVADRLTEPELPLEMLELLERQAEGQDGGARLRRLIGALDASRASAVREGAVLAAFRSATGEMPRDLEDVLEAARCAADPLLDAPPDLFAAERQAGRGQNEEAARQADLVRCVLGDPFSVPRLDPAWVAANDGAARRLAQAIDDERRFDELSVLADALEDAGCGDGRILGHCRSTGPHGRGCWVVELILGKG